MNIPQALHVLALGLLPLIAGAAAVKVRVDMLARVTARMLWLQCVVASYVCIPVIFEHHAPVHPWPGIALDPTAAIFILLTTIVTAAVVEHSSGYFARELLGGTPPNPRVIREFYLCTMAVMLCMYGIAIADNLGYLWIAVEASTLASAPLVYSTRSGPSLEAAWKYLIICSVGIAFAFFGTALVFAASQHALPQVGSLSLAVLTRTAAQMPPALLRFGYVFLLLGYGTKAGLFPLQFWQPDAYSESPAPGAAMLAGALGNGAMLALLRVSGIMLAAGQGSFVRVTLLPMGVLTTAVAALFLVRQRDAGRMLAYSSMENMGIMAVAISLGSVGGFCLQAICHSVTKTALFLLYGDTKQIYGTTRLERLRGLITISPVRAVVLLAGIAAVAGTPPFGSFLSEWHILAASVAAHEPIAAGVLLVSITCGFIALSIHACGIVFGDPPAGREILPQQFARRWRGVAAPILLLLIALWFGILVPTSVVSAFARLSP